MIHFLRVTLLLARTHFLRVLLSKRVVIVLLGCLVPPGIAWSMLNFPRRGPTPIEALIYPDWFLGLQMMVPLAALILGSAVISEEVDDRTITYLFTRPIPRAAVLIGRWLASLVVLLVLIGGSTLAHTAIVRHAAGSFVPNEPREIQVPRRHGETRTVIQKGSDPAQVALTEDGRLPEGLAGTLLVAALLGATAYSAVFAALGTFNKHPMIVGLGYCFAIEGFLANLPGQSQSLAIQYYIRSYVHTNALDVMKLMDGIQMSNAATPFGAARALVIITLVALAIGSVAVSRREYVLAA